MHNWWEIFLQEKSGKNRPEGENIGGFIALMNILHKKQSDFCGFVCDFFQQRFFGDLKNKRKQEKL